MNRTANTLLVQCGGPTPVINASLAGAIHAWQESGVAGRLWGSRHGMQGVVSGDWVELTDTTAAQLHTLLHQPAAALGSGRFGFGPEHLPQTREHLARRGVDGVILMGGNGTMGAAHLLAQTPGLRVMAVPKTIDNDIEGTDVTPGFGSAARFVARAARDVALDLYAMSTFDDVAVMQVMGRHVGWPAAAALLARVAPDDAPHLILVPEAPVEEDRLLARIAEIHARKGVCLVVAAEGICDSEGVYLAEKLGGGGRDERGQRVLSLGAGVAAYLANRVQTVLGLRCRQVRPDTILRSTSLAASDVDRELARLVGVRAMELLLEGATDQMVGLALRAGSWSTCEVPLPEVIGRTRLLPAEYLRAAEFDVAWELRDYLLAATGESEAGAPLIWS